MPRNGSGNYSLPTNAWNPAINGVSATPADWQALINDVAAAIQASVSADGQTPVTGNLQMGGHLLTGAGAPSGAGMSLRWEQLTRGTDIPSATSITIPLEGQFFAVTGSTAITGFDATIAGRLVYIKFDAGIALTNSASFILPGGANITTQADDIAVFLSVSIGVWKCVSYPRLLSSDFYDATPTITYAGMRWADSGTNTLWRRNATNDAWLYEHRILADATTDLQWLGTPIGGYITPLNAPPTNNPRYRYMLCTAGQTGAGGYNNGILTGETVTGTAPLLVATATVSLAGSPFNGLTAHLINTEGRFVGAGSTEALEDDALQNITGEAGQNVGSFGLFNSGRTSGAFALGGTNQANTAQSTPSSGTYQSVLFDASRVARTSDHTQPRTHRLPHYMRIL